ncbi:hypothetical protein DFJ73DRAFT_828287, partial [Zopfochytrium polystomum]
MQQAHDQTPSLLAMTAEIVPASVLELAYFFDEQPTAFADMSETHQLVLLTRVAKLLRNLDDELAWCALFLCRAIVRYSPNILRDHLQTWSDQFTAILKSARSKTLKEEASLTFRLVLLKANECVGLKGASVHSQCSKFLNLLPPISKSLFLRECFYFARVCPPLVKSHLGQVEELCLEILSCTSSDGQNHSSEDLKTASACYAVICQLGSKPKAGPSRVEDIISHAKSSLQSVVGSGSFQVMADRAVLFRIEAWMNCLRVFLGSPCVQERTVSFSPVVEFCHDIIAKLENYGQRHIPALLSQLCRLLSTTIKVGGSLLLGETVSIHVLCRKIMSMSHKHAGPYIQSLRVFSLFIEHMGSAAIDVISDSFSEELLSNVTRNSFITPCSPQQLYSIRLESLACKVLPLIFLVLLNARSGLRLIITYGSGKIRTDLMKSIFETLFKSVIMLLDGPGGTVDWITVKEIIKLLTLIYKQAVIRPNYEWRCSLIGLFNVLICVEHQETRDLVRQTLADVSAPSMWPTHESAVGHTEEVWTDSPFSMRKRSGDFGRSPFEQANKRVNIFVPEVRPPVTVLSNTLPDGKSPSQVGSESSVNDTDQPQTGSEATQTPEGNSTVATLEVPVMDEPGEQATVISVDSDDAKVLHQTPTAGTESLQTEMPDGSDEMEDIEFPEIVVDDED